MEVTLLEQARLTFAATAMYHFLFVPLTIGLAGVVAILQAIAIFRKDQAAQRLLDVFAPIFLINFVCGMITGYPLRSLIEHDWSVYLASSKPVFETVFGFENALLPANLALVSAYAFGRRWIPPKGQVAVLGALCACLMAQGSAILAINCYMQSPHGVTWGSEGVVFEGGLSTLFANPMWFQKFMHQMAGAMTLGATCCMSLAALFLLRRRHVEASRFVFKTSATVGLFFLCVTAWFGHESAHTLIRRQPMKFAAAEAIWDAERGSDRSHPFLLFGLPDQTTMRNTHVVQIPGLLTVLTGEDSRSIVGIAQLVEENERRIRRSVDDGETLGYASLLGSRANPTEADIARAAREAVPDVPVVFWAFRIMIYSSLLLFVAMAFAVFHAGRTSGAGRRVLWACVLACPLPWLAILTGWVVAEAGRQPWVITGVLSTAMAANKALATVQADRSILSAVLAAIAILGVNATLTVMHLRRARYLGAGDAAS